MLKINNNLRKYFIFFFIFAQDSNIPSRKVPSKYYAYIPTLVSICILTSHIRTLIELSPKSTHLSAVGNNVLLGISIICITPVVFALFENWTNPKSIPHILKEMLITKRYMENKMKIQFNQTAFERVFSWKFVALSLSTLSSFVVRIFISNSIVPYLLEFSYFSVILIKCIVVLHFVFYVDFVKTAFNSVNMHFDAMPNNTVGKYSTVLVFRSKMIISNLYDLKFVHFNMMKIILELNSRFGWTLFSLSLDAFLNVTTNIYWTFFYRITSPENALLIISNYYL